RHHSPNFQRQQATSTPIDASGRLITTTAASSGQQRSSAPCSPGQSKSQALAHSPVYATIGRERVIPVKLEKEGFAASPSVPAASAAKETNPRDEVDNLIHNLSHSSHAPYYNEKQSTPVRCMLTFFLKKLLL